MLIDQLGGHGQSFRAHKSVGDVLQQIYYYFTVFHSPWRYESLLPQIDPLRPHEEGWKHAVVSGLLAPFAVAFAWGIVDSARRRRFLLIAFAASQVGIVLIASRRVDLFEPKYLVALLPATSLLIAAGLAAAWDRRRIAALALAAGIALTTAIALAHLYFSPAYRKPDWRGFAEFAERTMREGDAVLIYSEPTMSDFVYYYRGPAPVYAILPGKKAGVATVDGEAVVEDAIARTGPAERIWFMDGLAFLHDPEHVATRVIERGRREVASYPVRPAIGFVFRAYEVAPAGGGR